MVFKKDFSRIPRMKVMDLLNLNPLQRLMLSLNLKEYCPYLSSYYTKNQYSIPSTIITLIDKFNSLKEKSELTYSVMRNLYKIIKIYAQFDLLEPEYISKFCILNDEVLQKMDEAFNNKFREGADKSHLIGIALIKLRR
jgi:hypothetical protein